MLSLRANAKQSQVKRLLRPPLLSCESKKRGPRNDLMLKSRVSITIQLALISVSRLRQILIVFDFGGPGEAKHKSNLAKTGIRENPRSIDY